MAAPRAGSRPLSRPAAAERCCPCHSPALRPWIDVRRLCTGDGTPSYVEELWSPSLWRAPRKPQAKADAYSQRSFPGLRAEGLSLSGGASIRPRACSSWASPFVLRSLSRLRNDEGDLPAALASSCYAASFLAHPPLDEGSGIADTVAVDDGHVPARRGQRGRGRFGEKHLGVDHHQHGACRRIEHEPSLGKRCL